LVGRLSAWKLVPEERDVTVVSADLFAHPTVNNDPKLQFIFFKTVMAKIRN